jgi:hypothetical protein
MLVLGMAECLPFTGDQKQSRLVTRARRAMPNPLLEPTRSDRQRKPGLRHLVHHLSPGLRRLPPRSAQLER